MILPDSFPHLDVLCHGNSEKVNCEDFQGFKWEGKPRTLNERVSNISESVHDKSQDEDIDNSNLADDVVRIEQEGDRD